MTLIDDASSPPAKGGAYLGIDMGGTGTRWVVMDGDRELARGIGRGATGHLFNATARENFAAVIAEIASEVPALRAVHLGATGLGGQSRSAAQDILARALGLGQESVSVGDDMDLAYRSAFAPGEGHLISVGTGSIGLHISADGQIVRVGGRGILIDDGGSGAWIALKALDGIYRIVDETGQFGDAAILARHLFAAIGGEEWEDVRAFVYGTDRGAIGTLARAVGAAAQEGDRLAKEIIAQAATELARLGLALIGRAGRKPVGFVGGVLDITPDFRSTIVAALDGHAAIFPRIDAPLGAARLALRASRRRQEV